MGKKFVPRLTAPSTSDKHWISTAKGGLSICLLIGGNSVLPNCVGYAWGRFYEILGEKPKLANLNAEDWYGNTADGYKRSETPKLGAVACWRKGNVWNGADGYGHVAVVEEIKPNGDIVCSNSAYGGTRFYIQTYSKSAGYNLGSLTFQGFILPPVDFSVKSETPSAISDSTVFKVGDIVDFTGNTHYSSSMGTNETEAKHGKAKITIIALGAKHPYHLINDGSGSTVYGWVDEKDIQPVAKKSIDEIVREVINGKWGNGNERKTRLTTAGYDYYAVQDAVNKQIAK